MKKFQQNNIVKDKLVKERLPLIYYDKIAPILNGTSKIERVLLSNYSGSCLESVQGIDGPFGEILDALKTIWANNSLFSEEANMVGLLSRVSNEVVNRCSKEIDAGSIFTGKHEEVSMALDQVKVQMFQRENTLEALSEC